VRIEPPVLAHARALAQLVHSTAQDSSVLDRSLEDICEHIREFLVAFEGEEIAGCVALRCEDETLAEVRTLCVAPAWRGKGVGRALVKALLEEARRLGVKRVYALTNQEPFFQRLGFVGIDRAALPRKVWRDCVKCPKFPNCDEVALIYELEKE